MENKYLWEILVPTRRNDGRPLRTRFHKVWDKKVRSIAGGLTIIPPVRGQWMDGLELYEERMIPVRIMCTEPQMQEIVKITLKHYDDQIATMYYRLSEAVEIVFRN